MSSVSRLILEKDVGIQSIMTFATDFLNGIHLGEVQLFAIEDADYLGRNNAYNHILRLSESMTKCQFVITADTMNSRIQNYQNAFMHNAQMVK